MLTGDADDTRDISDNLENTENNIIVDKRRDNNIYTKRITFVRTYDASYGRDGSGSHERQ